MAGEGAAAGRGQVGRGSPVSRSTICELLERKAPRITKNLGEDWTLHHAFCAREGFTDAAVALAREHDVLLVDVAQIDADLHRATGELSTKRPLGQTGPPESSQERALARRPDSARSNLLLQICFRILGCK